MAQNQTARDQAPSAGRPSNRGGGKAQRAGAEGLVDQAESAMRSAAAGASDLWDEAYERGGCYYRQGSQALGGVDTLTATMIAGAVGFGLAWLIFGQGSSRSEESDRAMRERDLFRRAYGYPDERRPDSY
jgi:hypothetical protein